MLKEEGDEMLSERQLAIFNLLVNLYTDTGFPVGSNTLMKNGIKASSATIRNDLVKLEDLGLIQKVHSSSGRIPSEEGYRFYIDNLMKPSVIPFEEQYKIRQLFNREYSATNEIIEVSAKILSDLTNYTAFSLGPEVKDRKLTSFKIIPLNSRQLIAIIVTDKGYVESQVFTVPEEVTASDIEKMINIINDRLIGKSLLTVYHQLRTEIPLILQRYFTNSSNMLLLFEDVFHQVFDDQIYVSGGMNLLDSGSLEDVSEFKSIYSLFTDTERLSELILPGESEIEIKVGNEINNELLTNMSLVTASYQVSDHGNGVVALLGPTSMSYAKMMGLLNVFKIELSDHLESHYRSLGSSNTSNG